MADMKKIFCRSDLWKNLSCVSCAASNVFSINSLLSVINQYIVRKTFDNINGTKKLCMNPIFKNYFMHPGCKTTVLPDTYIMKKLSNEKQ